MRWLHACAMRPAALVRVDHALVEVRAIRIEIDETGERAQRRARACLHGRGCRRCSRAPADRACRARATRPRRRARSSSLPAYDSAWTSARCFSRLSGFFASASCASAIALRDARADAVERGERGLARPHALIWIIIAAAIRRGGARHRFLLGALQVAAWIIMPPPTAADAPRRRRASMPATVVRRVPPQAPSSRSSALATVALVRRARQSCRTPRPRRCSSSPVHFAAGCAAIDAERVEHRLRLEHEQRGLARHHAVALRQRDDARAVFAFALALELIDRERRPQPRHEAVACRRRHRELDRIALLERLAGDLAAEHDVTGDSPPRRAAIRLRHRRAASAGSSSSCVSPVEQHRRRDLGDARGQLDGRVAQRRAVGRLERGHRGGADRLAGHPREVAATTTARGGGEQCRVGIAADADRSTRGRRCRRVVDATACSTSATRRKPVDAKPSPM